MTETPYGWVELSLSLAYLNDPHLYPGVVNQIGYARRSPPSIGGGTDATAAREVAIKVGSVRCRGRRWERLSSLQQKLGYVAGWLGTRLTDY